MKINRKGQVGAGFFTVPTAIIGGVLGLVVLGIVFLLVINVLRTSSILPANSIEANASTVLAANATQGLTTFAGYLPTVFIVGAVVLILAVLGFLLLYIYRSNMGGMIQ